MTRGFSPDGPGADDDSIMLGQANFNSGPTGNGISHHFAPDWDSRCPALTREDLMLRGRVSKLVAEGLQELEHASLVRCQLHTNMGYLDWQRLDVVGLHSSAARSKACSRPPAVRTSPEILWLRGRKPDLWIGLLCGEQ